ncbi:MAG: hypothetical protein OER88_03590 [Planctomycetota bacterium]|nr:hypothetical protein [Planctomycetota bacterium]
MTDQNLPVPDDENTGEGEEFESSGVDETSLPDEVIPEAPIVAAPAVDEPPPLPPGPRQFKEHFTILLGAALVVAAGLAVWERGTIYGVEVRGTQSILRTFMLGFALYTVAAGIANIATGRLRGMGTTFVTGVMALWMGVKGFLAFNDVDGFKGWQETEQFLKEHGGSNFQRQIEHYLSQWAPGVWLATVGGALILWVFLKAIIGGGKKKAPAPAPARSSSRRRR